MTMIIYEWLARFSLDGTLREHIAAVVLALPEPVRAGLMSDPNFSLMDYEPGPGGIVIPMGNPGKSAARAVVLKRNLRLRPHAFVRYVIAHELAHAHLKNRGRTPAEDPELAADALAAEWGFPRARWDS